MLVHFCFTYSVLDLDAFERTNKAEGLGMSSEPGAGAGEKNMHDAEFTCKLFRFLQLLCEGHNLGGFLPVINSMNGCEKIEVKFSKRNLNIIF